MPTRGGSSRPRASRGVREPASRLRARSGTATTSNSRPLALCTVMIRTPSCPSTAVAAWASASPSARAARKSSRPRRSRPSRCSNSAARRVSLRTFASLASPAGRIRTARSYPVSLTAASISAASGRRDGALAQRRQPCAEGAQQLPLGRGDLLEALGLVQLGLARARGALQRRPDVAARPGGGAQQPERVRRDARRQGRRGRRTAPGRRAGWRSSPAARRRRRPAAGTSSRARRRRRGAGRRARASPRRRRGG